MSLIQKKILIPDNILSRVEDYNGQKIIVLYNIDNNDLIKGNDDMLNLVFAIEKFDTIDKITKELVSKYQIEDYTEIETIVSDSISTLIKQGFVQEI